MDAKAIFTTVAVMVLANGVVLANIYRDLPQALRPAAIRWQAGTVLVALGCGVFAFGHVLPMPAMLTLANAALTFGLTVYHRALRTFYGLPPEPWDVVPPLLAAASVYSFSAIHPDFMIRLGIISIIWLWIMGRSTALLHGMRTSDRSRSRSMLTIIYAFVMVYVAVRFLAYLRFDLPRDFSVTANDYGMNIVSPIVMALLPAIGTTTFVLLCSDRLRRQFEVAASTDDLTGLANRRTLIAHGKARFKSELTVRRGLAFAVLDLDAFKAINDSYGHEIGDRALVHVAEQFRKSGREHDLIARSGGEEFVVVMEGLDHNGAVAVAEQLRSAVESTPFRVEGKSIRITISAGVAVALPEDRSFDDVLGRAGDPNEAGFWRDLLNGASPAYQQPLAEIGLAVRWQRDGRVEQVFAPGSPITDPGLREVLLQTMATPAILRANAKDTARPAHERDVARFTLLYKNLTRGAFGDFVNDLSLVPANADSEGGLWDFAQQEKIPVGLFRKGTWSDGFPCPAITQTAATLARSPADRKARLCLGDFYRLNGFDDFSLFRANGGKDVLGSGPDGFPGRVTPRSAIYAAIIADRAASPDERAYALYRAVMCYAPSGYNGCGGPYGSVDEMDAAQAPQAQRKAWFTELKQRYPDSKWAKTLRYYW
ncbi:MAG: GGDEF domain-containing protein [Sphingobium sp.]